MSHENAAEIPLGLTVTWTQQSLIQVGGMISYGRSPDEIKEGLFNYASS